MNGGMMGGSRMSSSGMASGMPPGMAPGMAPGMPPGMTGFTQMPSGGIGSFMFSMNEADGTKQRQHLGHQKQQQQQQQQQQHGGMPKHPQTKVTP